ncbi:MAG: TPM domain-containing protein [Spirochaetaceae bacterium]|nr:MAG: TPM domain-containing protein [Spirochaetaceae bacterium]
MKNLASKFLSDPEKQTIQACVKEVEKRTSGEIVPMVVSASYHYPMSNMIGGLIFALLIAIAVTLVYGIQKSWGGVTALELWVFPAVFAVAFLLFHELVKRISWLKRIFITKAEIAEEVEEAALTSFYRNGLNNTRDRTGILIFISVFERKAYVLADEGINSKVKSGVWQEVVNLIVDGIKQHHQADGICRAVRRCGDLIREHFPIKADDTNELDNLIVED